ncbi:hypothetical protein VW29_18905 [Devosia limi DSM 17137]|uniref:Pilus assembly protein CpaC n=1 Tax=Devosia limi DSM 17137 TaxID=1121477 RepID=A0A0F5L3W5_9HYPH|nr:type II and III secretion system protein family protein [Devosia limi]KKB77033.1 hypothetical protein VW29_18905 [Devosia limi DSM 17137]SHF42700.1 pilus assembly protein CpaC [Devosia limi DSM 17137]
MLQIPTLHRRNPRRNWLGATMLAAMLAGTAALTAPASAQAQISLASYGGTRSIELELNKSMVVDLPGGVAEVIVSQPSVASAIMRTRQRAVIQGIGGGDTNILFLDDRGSTIGVLDIKVIKEPSQVGAALEAALARVLPGSAIRVESVTLGDSTNRVVLTGTVLSAEDRDRAASVAVQFAGDPENVANILDVAGSQQVMLQVTVSEIKRDVAKELGINLSGSVTLGSATFGFNNTMAGATATANGATGSFAVPNLEINAAVRALEGRGALRVLAQPTLTAISGETANFLAGGELPYYSRNADGDQEVLFKPYGVELKFTPVVRSNGMVALKVETSVSDPQPNGSLTKRQASTSVELPPGNTLAIGGLLEERVRQQIDQLPGLGNIPILGALFRSREYQTSQTELVIMVTPYLVGSSIHPPVLPTERSAVASDAESIFLGKLETMYGVGSGGMRGGFSGSVGFVLE